MKECRPTCLRRTTTVTFEWRINRWRHLHISSPCSLLWQRSTDADTFLVTSWKWPAHACSSTSPEKQIPALSLSLVWGRISCRLLYPRLALVSPFTCEMQMLPCRLAWDGLKTSAAGSPPSLWMKALKALRNTQHCSHGTHSNMFMLFNTVFNKPDTPDLDGWSWAVWMRAWKMVPQVLLVLLLREGSFILTLPSRKVPDEGNPAVVFQDEHRGDKREQEQRWMIRPTWGPHLSAFFWIWEDYFQQSGIMIETQSVCYVWSCNTNGGHDVCLSSIPLCRTHSTKNYSPYIQSLRKSIC